MANVIITDKCSKCGHSEDDHISEDDNSYCVGALQDSTQLPHDDYTRCNCHKYT